MPVIGSLPTPDLLTNLAQLGGARFPGANTAVPSFLKTYRGYGAIQPHQTIPGYQRFHVGQLDLTAIKAFSKVLGADQILMITEIGFTQIRSEERRVGKECVSTSRYRWSTYH